MNKRGIGIFLLSLFVGVFAINFVSAAAFGAYELRGWISEGIDSARVATAPIFEMLLGEYENYDFFWIKVLLMGLLFIMISFILTKIDLFKENKGVIRIVSAVVSIFAVRYMNENELIRGIFLPYAALGVALTTILPFLIFGYFVHKGGFNSGGRKLAWMFFAIVFAVLWYNRQADLSPIGNQIYAWTLVGIAIVFLFDSKLHEYFGIQEDKEWRRNLLRAQIVRIETNIADVKTKNPGYDSKGHVGIWVEEEEKKLLDLKRKFNRL